MFGWDEVEELLQLFADCSAVVKSEGTKDGMLDSEQMKDERAEWIIKRRSREGAYPSEGIERDCSVKVEIR